MTLRTSLGNNGPNIDSMDEPPEAPPIGTCDVCRDEIVQDHAWRISYGDGRKAQTGHDECIEVLWIQDTSRLVAREHCAAIADGQIATIERVEPCGECGALRCGGPG